ncbi:MAG: hypothetical protein PHE55_11495 [Methylococcaceae bacterium]|nr:hypothetical protein [Methylococcaceae bacterium]
MYSRSSFLRAFKKLVCDITKTHDLSSKFSEEDRERAREISDGIADLASKEIKFIEDIDTQESPDARELRDRIDTLVSLMQDDRDKFYFSQYSAMLNSYNNDTLTKARLSARIRTPEQRFELMKEAGILDDEGYYSSTFFSPETVEKDRARSKRKAS